MKPECYQLNKTLLSEKITAYKKKEKQPSQFNQVKSLVQIKEQNPKLKQIFSQVLQNIPKQRNGKWYVCFTGKVETQPFPKTGKKIGTDMGLNDFCVLDNGEKVPIPQFYRRLETQLNELNRIGDRKQHKRNKEDKTKPSQRYLKHKSKVEIKKMIECRIIVGKQVVEVNPKNTSKRCFDCKMIKKDLELKDRIFVCVCGYEADRDVNAAKNILYKVQATEQELSSLDENMEHNSSSLKPQRGSPHLQIHKD
ncbi:19366_t:CDS:2 [Funneliformis geosporum]|uniref:19366_t:CDS:1 n=1 Tax=Funneliformis geosporum TaxID=1117311 RepID=A0A9W4T6I3_9GLOM|nr:19366_t:CDS:2 [Funneliformis geosporum]